MEPMGTLIVKFELGVRPVGIAKEASPRALPQRFPSRLSTRTQRRFGGNPKP